MVVKEFPLRNNGRRRFVRVGQQFIVFDPGERDMQDQQKGVDIDLTEISLAGYPEISDGCIALGCSEVQLAEAIAVVGYLPGEVRDYLTNGRGATPPSP